MAFGMGESVGSAYVKLYADGSGVPGDVKEAMDKLEPEMREAGERHMAAYEKGRQKQAKKDTPKTREQLINDLKKGIGRFEVIGEQMGTGLFDGIQVSLTRELERSDITAEVAERMRQNFEAEFAKTGDTKLLGRRLQNLAAEVERAQAELLSEFIASSKKAEDEAARAVTRRTAEMEKFEKETRRLFAETDKVLAESQESLVEYGKARERLGVTTREFLRNEGKGWLDLSEAQEKARKKTGELDNAYRRFNKTLDDQAKFTGRMFGKGARNNFLNFIGSSIAGLTHLIFLAPKAASRLGEIFSGAGGSLDLGKVASAAAAGFVGIVAAVSALILLLGPVAALISGVTAAVVALAASLAFAAGAVGGVALGLAGVLVPAIGVAILAFTHLDEETKRVARSVGDEFGKLGDSAGKAIGPGLRDALRTVKPEIAGLAPLVDAVSASLGNVALGWAKITKGQAYRDFVAALTVFLPGAIESLGTSFGSFGEGLMGVFRAARPLMTRFLGWLEDITSRFADWANSPKGQTELLSFFQRAGDSAESVGKFIGRIGDALATLFDKGQGAGDELFVTAADNVERFVNYLTDPANQEAIEDFFANGVDTAENLGTLLEDIAGLIDDFDTAESREELDKLFGAVGDVLDALGKLVDIWEFLWDNRVIELDVVLKGDASLWERFKAVWPFARISSYVASSIGSGLRKVSFKSLDNVASRAVRSVGNIFERLPGRIRAAVDDTPGKVRGVFNRLQGIASNAVSRATRPFNNLGERISRAANDIPAKIGLVFGRAVRVVTLFPARMASPFKALAGMIGTNLAGVPAAFALAFGKAVAVAAQFPAMIASKFSGLAGQILGQIGTIDIGSLIRMPANLGAGFLSGLKGNAAGTILTGPEIIYAGEAGPEAVVPLNRPLSQVDPSVRHLSAIAQGLASPANRGAGTVVNEGAIKVYEVANPRATASAVLNEYVARVG